MKSAILGLLRYQHIDITEDKRKPFSFSGIRTLSFCTADHIVGLPPRAMALSEIGVGKYGDFWSFCRNISRIIGDVA